jgi:hypothetical protein
MSWGGVANTFERKREFVARSRWANIDKVEAHRNQTTKLFAHFGKN